MSDFLAQDIRRRYPPSASRLAKVIVVEAGQTILSAFDQSLADYASKQLKSRNVDIHFGAKSKIHGIKEATKLNWILVKEVRKNQLVMHDGTIIPFGCCVWATVVASRPLVQQLPLLKSKDGRLVVDNRLKVFQLFEVVSLS